MDGLIPRTEIAKARRRYLVRKGVMLGRPLVGPLEMAVIPTYKCHYRCVFCALESEAPAKKPDMPVEVLHRLIDDLAALDAEQVSYTGGGEPLLYKGIDELVAHTREKGMAVSICTNGDLLTEERIEAFARIGVHLSISINAATPGLYAGIHPRTKPGTFERIVERLTAFSRVARDAGDEGSFVSLNFVLINSNCHQVKDMAALGRQVGANQIQFRHIQPRPVHKHLFMSPEQLEATRAAIRDVELQYRDVDNYAVQVMEILRAQKGTVCPEGASCSAADLARDEDLIQVPCIEGYVAGYVDADGVVFPCCMRSTSIGNHWMGTLQEQSFAEIWHSETYQAFRREALAIDRLGESASENSCRFCPKAKQFVYAVDEFGPGNYAHLYRGLARDLFDQVQSLGVAQQERSPIVPDADCRVRFVLHDMPKEAKAGEVLTVNVTVANEGAGAWPGVAKWNGVSLGYHLLDRRRRMVRFDNNPRAALPEDLAPGAETTLALSIAAPEEPGKYFVELAMIQENVAWFEARGGATLRIPLKVVR